MGADDTDGVRLKITRLQDGLAITVPEGLAARLGWRAGDTVRVNLAEKIDAEIGNPGSISVEPVTVEQLRAGHEFLRDYHAAFRALAR